MIFKYIFRFHKSVVFSGSPLSHVSSIQTIQKLLYRIFKINADIVPLIINKKFDHLIARLLNINLSKLVNHNYSINCGRVYTTNIVLQRTKSPLIFRVLTLD